MKTFLKTLIVLIISVIILTVLFYLPIWDDGEIRDQDLILPPPLALADDENLYHLLAFDRGLNTEESIALEQISNWEYDERKVSELSLSELQLLLTGTESAATKLQNGVTEAVGYTCPLYNPEVDASEYGCDLNIKRQIAELASAYGWYLLRSGQIDQALVIVNDIARYGQLLAENPHPQYLDVFLAVGVQKIAIELADSIPDEVMLGNYTFDAQVWGNALRQDYMNYKALVEQVHSQGSSNHYWYQPNRTINTMANFFRDYVAVANQPCPSEWGSGQLSTEDQKSIDWLEWSESAQFQFYRRNFHGNLLTVLLLESVNGFFREDLCVHRQNMFSFR